jgi:hypothetical protein
MSEPILTRARNIYEQQSHNRRMTWLLIVAFVLLIAVVGVGFDVFLTMDSPVRFIVLPFVLMMVASGIWNFQQRAAEGLWKKPLSFAEDDDSDIYRLPIYIVFGTTMLMIMLLSQFFPHKLLPAFFSNRLLHYMPVGTFLAIIIGIASILTSLRWGMNSVLWCVQATRSDEETDYSPELFNIVKEISLAAGIPTPSLYVPTLLLLAQTQQKVPSS